MSEPTLPVFQVKYQNPHATIPLYIPVAVMCNTPDADLERNVRANTARDLDWVFTKEPHETPAIMVGGGPSMRDHLGTIQELGRSGGDIFAMNGAANFLYRNKTPIDYQVIADAKPETAQLVCQEECTHLFASQVHPDTMNSVSRPVVWHLAINNLEDWFPKERRKKGGYTLIGGGAAVGNSALCLAYSMGYREFHLFGYDSCHRDGQSHAYSQPMNMYDPLTEVEWAGKKYTCSLTMKCQAERFQVTGKALEDAGCKLRLYGDGLLQAMYLTKPENLTEKDKYRLMWQFQGYREISPGECLVPVFLGTVEPDEGSMVIDFGCGTGRAGLALREQGHEVYLIDFADNCRDQEALSLPFLEWDLTGDPIPLSAQYGFCTDVMEHIPPDDVHKALTNIFGSAQEVFFQIATRPDIRGVVIREPLHLTVLNHSAWRNILGEYGTVLWEQEHEGASLFHVQRKEHTE